MNNRGRFPDYELITPAGSVIVEIKEFTPNAEDEAFAKKMKSKGRADFTRSSGKRVHKAIMDSAQQLGRYKDSPMPEVLLLYDNTGNVLYLDPVELASGMFGEPVIRFSLDPSGAPVGATTVIHGGGRQLTEKFHLHIGAVGVLKADSSSHVHINFFHNPFSKKHVRPGYFVHPDDHHYVKSNHPHQSDWLWDKVFDADAST
jgi:hypothetical protein